ncbi:MAG: 4Fe-4S dicluster domain-containing protein [Bacteriovoracaceae bacterium]
MSQMMDENLSREFEGPAELSALDRREFLRYLGLFSSMTLLAHCSRKPANIIPFVNEQKEFAVHNYEYYASAFPSRGFAQGVLVKSYQGRPVKIEGNPDHPWSRGATSAQAQAALYELYHPGRLTTPLINGKKAKLEDVRGVLLSFRPQDAKGSDVAFIIPALHSPTMTELLTELRKKYPEASFVSPSPWKSDSFTTYDLEAVNSLLTFDEDLFSGRPDYLILSRAFMKRRKMAIDTNSPHLLNHLYVVSSSPTLAGAKSDDQLFVSRGAVWNSALDLLDELEGKKTSNTQIQKWLPELKKSGLVVIDRSLHPDAGALEALINSHLGHSGKSWDTRLPENTTVTELQAKMKAGAIHTAFILEAEFTLDSDWQSALEKVPVKITHSLFPNETTAKSTTIIPASHWLEAWGDIATPQGLITIQQPLIEPLYPSLGIHRFLSLLLGDKREEQEIFESKWRAKTNWEEALKKGVVSGEIAKSTTLPSKKIFTRLPVSRWEILVRPDPSIGFGEHAENPVLQELPRPFTRLTWSNALLLSENEADHLKVKNEDLIRVKTENGTLEGPVLITSMVSDGMIITYSGFGKKKGTQISGNRGFFADSFNGAKVTTVEKIRGKKRFARVQLSMHMDDHPPVKTATLPVMKPPQKATPASFYPEHPIPAQEQGPQWGMTIDLTTCIGCEACVAACQTENNIPFVGEDQVKKHRYLHWLRIDNYIDEKTVFFQPVPCMHCEKAPCEVVCPVNATVHGNGGLNEMVYNRCVGTRYCSNNCPYKVRRFNFRSYSAVPKPWNMGFNPDVSVRDRGVMEKCTFCVQRIKSGERYGETVKTACQTVCPTEAIVFGDLRDEKSIVAENKKSPRNYDLLEEEGTRPRTSYLKVIRGNA